MSSLDVRSRTDQDMRVVDVEEFFEHEFSTLAEANGVLALAGARELDVAPFSFITESGTWTLALVGSTFRVTRGEGDGPCVHLSDQEFGDLVNDLLTPTTLVASANVRMPRGRLNDLFDWWVVLRSLLDARPAHTAGSVGFRDRDGGALDVGRSFSPEDDDADIAQFLKEAGFLHLSGWFTDDQMAHDQRRHGSRASYLRPGRRAFMVGGDGRRHKASRTSAGLRRAQSDAAGVVAQ